MNRQESTSSATKTASDQMHVLVVNDTQEILDLFEEILEDEGYRVSLLSYAPNEMEIVRDAEPDMVILDFMFDREARGWQLLQKLRMNKETADMPVIVCTAAIDLVKELEGHLTAKNVGVLIKPFDINELIQCVNRLKPETFA